MKHDYKVLEISRFRSLEFIQEFHYSPVVPRAIKHHLGFFVNDELKGVVTLGWGTQPRQTINRMFPGLDGSHYFEIGKMAMDDDMPRNSESQMLSQTVKWIRKNVPNCLFLYTLADGIMGKCGYVYQASNFYFGEKYLTDVYLMENGERLHPRSCKELLKENAEFENKEKLYWMTTGFMRHKKITRVKGYMFRYIYPLNNKAKRAMKKQSTLDWTKDYPKEKDLEWYDATDNRNRVKIEQPNFVFDEIEYNKANVNRHKLKPELTDFFSK